LDEDCAKIKGLLLFITMIAITMIMTKRNVLILIFIK